MKLAVTARGPGPEFEVDESFGRSYWYLIHDSESETWEMVDNAEIRNAVENAGVKAVQVLVGLGVAAVLTGETGPKAFRALVAAGIDIYQGVSGTAQEAVQAWRNGMLEKARTANSMGSPNCLIGRTAAANESGKGPGQQVKIY